MDLKPHGLAEESSAGVTRALHSLVPLSWQLGFRDMGIFGVVCDGLVTLSAVALPHHAPHFLRLGSAQRSFRYGSNAQHSVHIIDLHDVYGSPEMPEPDDVLVFVHGGAWGSGKPWMYRITAAGLARNGLRARYVVLLEYPVYPVTSILQQRNCVCEAMRFIRSMQWRDQMHQYSSASSSSSLSSSSSSPSSSQSLPSAPPVPRLILAGHSSGANVCALALLHAAREGYRLADAFLGLSGVYDVGKHFEYERSRGVHLISPMGGAAGWGRQGTFQECSPTVILQQWAHDCSKLSAFFPECCLILHGTEDSTVPITSSMDFVKALHSAGVGVGVAGAGRGVSTAYPQVGHVHPMIELMSEESSLCLDAIIRWRETGHGWSAVPSTAKSDLRATTTAHSQRSKL